MTVTMKADRIHVFGGPEVILFEDVARPTPGTGEVLVRVPVGGVGPGRGPLDRIPPSCGTAALTSVNCILADAGISVQDAAYTRV